MRDEFNETEFSPVHFEPSLVMELLKATIATKRTDQKFVLLEGMCNQAKLTNEDDQMQMRHMDELFQIESQLGEVKGIIALQFNYEEELANEQAADADGEEEEVYEQMQPVPEEEPQPEGEGEGEGDAAAEKKPTFKPELYKWTVTNRKPKSLSHLFTKLKAKSGTKPVHDVKSAEHFSSSQYEAISKSLDEFCQRASSDEKSIWMKVQINRVNSKLMAVQDTVVIDQ